ncbi:DUF5330 domain-containing protein [Candidatus Liberibacter americanus]|uniref:DUF5330 domain-containing protein n=1 Tax=Candidatus Liberibacter americanus TaxID=309868 RepID=UPI0002C60323|nr:DUF5330 domain-containing protein [Candidatus Liberibacter americanus]EMS35930.1 hypothetical protein G653_04082 [Candidatus Liberibacter americanus PW_SP]
MFSIFKKIFWISMAFFILSKLYPEHLSKQEKSESDIHSDIKDIATITSNTFNYASNVCNVQPDTCVVWHRVVSSFKKHTIHGAKIAYRFIKSSIDSNEKNPKVEITNQSNDLRKHT